MLDIIKGKKVLITGATGFIGSNLAHKCVFGEADVHILIRKTSDIWRLKNNIKNITVHDVDLLDFDKVNSVVTSVRPEIIFHTATFGGSPDQKNSRTVLETNFWATVNLVNICNAVGFDIFVNTGSSSEYGIQEKPITENCLLEPLSDYGVAKASSSLYCQALAKREKKAIVTLRLFSPYGYYEDRKRLVSSVILACLNGIGPSLSCPNNVRDFVFIEDVLAAYLLAVKNKTKVIGKIINIGTAKQSSVKEVVDAVIKISKKNISPLWGREENPRIEPLFWQADISLAKQLLSWEAKYDLFAGLEKNYNWFNLNRILY